ncbi:MAG: TIGR02206 family membrane protein [Rhizomicrobium sp.]
MGPAFHLFGPAHLIALALAFVVPAALASVTRQAPRRDRWARLFLAALLLSEWLGFYGLFLSRGWLDWANGLPLSLCDWAQGALIVALIRPNLPSYELGYFWGLAGTLQALITPDLAFGFPDARFFLFMLNHAGVIAALLYLTWGTGLRPVAGSLPRVVAATLVYVAAAGSADYALGANYGFLREKTSNVSLLTWLSPWPWYIGELVPIALLFLGLYYAPFLAADIWRKHEKP